MDSIDKIRLILNAIFMIGAVVSVILYFALADDKSWFFYVCAATIFVKLMEFVLRFFLR